MNHEAQIARLVAALRGLVKAYDARLVDGGVDFRGRVDVDGAGPAWDAAITALEGTDPDVVAELRAQVAKLKAEGPWMVLHDLAEEGGLASERAIEVMKALGMKV